MINIRPRARVSRAVAVLWSGEWRRVGWSSGPSATVFWRRADPRGVLLVKFAAKLLRTVEAAAA